MSLLQMNQHILSDMIMYTLNYALKYCPTVGPFVTSYKLCSMGPGLLILDSWFPFCWLLALNTTGKND